MKKPSPIISGNRESAAALMALISEELKKAEKQKNASSLVDWLEMGRMALDKFGDSNEGSEFRLALEKSFAYASSCAELGEFGEDFGETQPVHASASPPLLAYEEKFTPEAAASVMNSCILFCDVIITGDDAAVGLKYDEENMFIPMIVILEKDAAAEALVWAAENLGVPIIKNIMLAKNLAYYGKTGGSIPENSYREVLMVLARLGTGRPQIRRRIARKNRQGIPVKIPRPLSIELGDSLYALTSETVISGEEPGREKLLSEPLNAIRNRLQYLLGFPVPPFRVSLNSELGIDEYRIFFKGLEAGRGRLDLGWYQSFPGADGRRSRRANNSGTAIPDLMRRPENIRAAAKAASALIINHTERIIQKRAPELLGRDEVDAILDAAEEKYPVVTGEVKSLLSLGIIREILQSLVSEHVPIRHIAVILETLADWGSFGSAPSWMIIEQIRQALKRQICLEYTDDKLNLRVLTLEPKLENKIEGLSPEPGAAVIIPPEDDWVDLISAAALIMKEEGFPPVILCSPKARFPVKEATRGRLPDLAVLSYLEIPQDVSVKPVGEIRM